MLEGTAWRGLSHATARPGGELTRGGGLNATSIAIAGGWLAEHSVWGLSQRDEPTMRVDLGSMGADVVAELGDHR